MRRSCSNATTEANAYVSSWVMLTSRLAIRDASYSGAKRRHGRPSGRWATSTTCQWPAGSSSALKAASLAAKTPARRSGEAPSVSVGWNSRRRNGSPPRRSERSNDAIATRSTPVRTC